MGTGARRNILSLHRKIAKDQAKTLKANQPGGRYHKPSVAERLATVTGTRPYGKENRSS